MADVLESPGSPDLDTIKMFVGQIPKIWTEQDIKDALTEFGPIFSTTILRDKVTKQSRGCCFITFYQRKSALDAQNACHNVRILPGMCHPMQMKPADNENRHERKIFVGMLTKSLVENDLRKLFVSFGLIEEVSILRDGNGISRGCGFVTFGTKAAALNAIRTMHQSTIMEGCSSPLVVKIADVQQKGDKILQKEHIQKNQPQNHKSSSQECCANLLQNLFQNSEAKEPLGNISHFGNSVLHLSELSILNLIVQAQAHQNFLLNQSKPACRTMASEAYNLNQNLNSIETLLSSLMTPSPLLFQVNQLGGQLPMTRIHPEGPDGSNLFIYHLPQDFGDTDLIQLFSPFGIIISARVFIDRKTNLSKCFGFVSYDNNLSAQLAINGLNGFTIGSKRLKVQVKRPKEKPY